MITLSKKGRQITGCTRKPSLNLPIVVQGLNSSNLQAGRLSMLSALTIKLPECEVVKLPDDHVGIKVSDHYMSHIDAYLASTIERR